MYIHIFAKKPKTKLEIEMVTNTSYVLKDDNLSRLVDKLCHEVKNSPHAKIKITIT